MEQTVANGLSIIHRDFQEANSDFHHIILDAAMGARLSRSNSSHTTSPASQSGRFSRRSGTSYEEVGCAEHRKYQTPQRDVETITPMTRKDYRAAIPDPRRRSRQPVSHGLDLYLTKWNLVADGEQILTTSSSLLPVRAAGAAAMLKISTDPQERVGSALMEWWDGDGAARVLARKGDALLMERAAGSRSLAAMSRSDDDAEACRVLCAVAQRLRTPRPNPPPNLTPIGSQVP